MVNFRLVPDSHCKGSPRSVGAENKMMNNNQDEVADEFMKIMILIMMTLMVISCKLFKGTLLTITCGKTGGWGNIYFAVVFLITMIATMHYNGC